MPEIGQRILRVVGNLMKSKRCMGCRNENGFYELLALLWNQNDVGVAGTSRLLGKQGPNV